MTAIANLPEGWDGARQRLEEVARLCLTTIDTSFADSESGDIIIESPLQLEHDIRLLLASPPPPPEREENGWREALERADGLINQMSDYIGKMAVPAEFFAALNEHWLFMERLPRPAPPPPSQEEKGKGG